MSDCNYCGEERTKNHYCAWMKSECVRINKLLKNLGSGCGEPLYTEREIIDRIMACDELSIQIYDEDSGTWGYADKSSTDEVIAALEK